jgi:hypothetical protein
MAANVVFLTRITQLFVKYTACTRVEVTSSPTAYGGVTGVATTNLVSVPGSTPVDGYSWTFTNLAGGSALNAGVRYFIRDASGSDFKLAEYQGGPAIDFTTDITNASAGLMQPSEICIWSSEFRDIFSPTGVTLATPALGGSLPTMTAALASDLVLNPAVGPSTSGYVSGTPGTTNSDEIAHQPLRQTLLPRSYWKFTMSTVPTTLYAEVMEGDIISDTAPNIV